MTTTIIVRPPLFDFGNHAGVMLKPGRTRRWRQSFSPQRGCRFRERGKPTRPNRVSNARQARNPASLSEISRNFNPVLG